MNLACHINSGFFNENAIFLIPLVCLIIIIGINLRILRNDRSLTTIIILSLFSILGIFWSLVATIATGIFVINNIFQPIAAVYSDLNAAIKNTCYLDPLKRNCPTSLEGVIAIQDKDFAPLLKGKSAYFSRDETTNNYALVIRDKFGNGVIYDPRLASIHSYGYDFIDVTFGCSSIPKSRLSEFDDVVQEYLQTIWPKLNPRPF